MCFKKSTKISPTLNIKLSLNYCLPGITFSLVKSPASGHVSKTLRKVLHWGQMSRSRKLHSAFETKITTYGSQQAAHMYSSCIKRLPLSYSHPDISVPLVNFQNRNSVWILLHNHKCLWPRLAHFPLLFCAPLLQKVSVAGFLLLDHELKPKRLHHSALAAYPNIAPATSVSIFLLINSSYWWWNELFIQNHAAEKPELGNDYTGLWSPQLGPRFLGQSGGEQDPWPSSLWWPGTRHEET